MQCKMFLYSLCWRLSYTAAAGFTFFVKGVAFVPPANTRISYSFLLIKRSLISYSFLENFQDMGLHSKEIEEHSDFFHVIRKFLDTL